MNDHHLLLSNLYIVANLLRIDKKGGVSCRGLRLFRKKIECMFWRYVGWGWRYGLCGFVECVALDVLSLLMLLLSCFITALLPSSAFPSSKIYKLSFPTFLSTIYISLTPAFLFSVLCFHRILFCFSFCFIFSTNT